MRERVEIVGEISHRIPEFRSDRHLGLDRYDHVCLCCRRGSTMLSAKMVKTVYFRLMDPRRFDTVQREFGILFPDGVFWGSR